MRKLLVVIYVSVVALGSMPCKAQLILNNQCQAFTEQPFFNPDFIKRNRIKSIHGKTSTKRENDIVRSNDLIQYYEFDKEGRVIKQMYSHNSFSYRTDTTTIIFIYDSIGRLITKRQNDNFSFYSYNYEYDSLGRVVRETYNRDENCGLSKYHFELGNSYEITSETYKYEILNDKTVKKYFNNFGREYQLRELYCDKLNYLKCEKMFYSLTGRQTVEINYEYNEGGYCISRTEKNTDGIKVTTAYDYDKKGNLIEYEYINDENTVTHRELLYDHTTMLLSAILTKDLRTNIISIVKYTYEFY